MSTHMPSIDPDEARIATLWAGALRYDGKQRL